MFNKFWAFQTCSSHESLATHQRTCTQRYNCNRCSSSFNTAEELVTHETTHIETDETGEPLEHENWENWCSLCNQWVLFESQSTVLTYGLFQIYVFLKGCCPALKPSRIIRRCIANRTTMLSGRIRWFCSGPLATMDCKITLATTSSHFSVLRVERYRKNLFPQFSQVKWQVNDELILQVCTQQSALSNHMRMHEPKKFKCEICGRFFGLAVRLQVCNITFNSSRLM